ncbi:tyrosine--tRNA ligase [Candidatus Woesearchaeota archaeon]|nr:tyrosine--tRNA ligase [Candidatus Woesearchaeota archaeon]MCF7900888.1 tyrosine--tRNA ligase [Candidatus Woesearchaeota archaeon]MCF8013063.1 tyrosine--tRNA ligase [Candidatus Woesearchaeota archaeon]
MKPEDKYHLIVRDLQEVVDEEKLKSVLNEKDLNIYWGTAPTGSPHFGYFVPMFKIADFLEAGCQVTILFANMHAYLDNMKSSWDLLEKRTKYYEFIIKEMLTLIGVPLDKLKFVKGTDFQLEENYSLDVYKLSALASTRDTQRAGAEVVKQLDNPKMSGLLYPILQALDEHYLNVDAQFGGVDQRKIFMFAREFLPKIGYDKKIHLMNYLVPGLGESGKMSSSESNSKIDFDDSDKIIRKKINKAFSVDGQVEGNGLLAILKFVIFKQLNRENRTFVIDRPEQYGGKIEFKTYDDVELAFANKDLSSIDLKQGLADEIINFVGPLRSKLEENKNLVDNAYPS